MNTKFDSPFKLVLLAVVAFAASLAGAQSLAPRIATEVTSAERTPLRNSLHPMAQAQFDAGRMSASTPIKGITLVFSRSAAQEAALKELIAAQQNPASPLYHQWLTPDTFAARFGMAASDLEKAQSWLQEQGFSIDSVARSRNAIRFSGNVRQVEQAFSTEMHFYRVNGAEHYAPSTALSVPAALAPAVLAVNNLNDFKPRSHLVMHPNAPKRHFTGAGSTDASNQTILFAPGDIATAYDIKPLYNASISGTGQSITLVGQSAILTSDIEAFQTANGLTVSDPNQYVVPGSGTPMVAAGDEAESDLDVEWSGAMAPGATINFVYTGNDSNYSAFDSIQYAIDQGIGTIISSSYGVCETALGTDTLESIFEQGTSQGQTLIAAAGDDGSTDCSGETGLTSAQQDALAVDYPASSQYVTGMGGTEYSQAKAAYYTVGDGYWESNSSTTSDLVDSVEQYIPEVVWNDDSTQYGLSASGGGASALFPKPTWQTGVAGIPADSKRDVPDLALYGSPNYPGYLYCSSDQSAWSSNQTGSCTAGFEDAGGYLTAAGGTSFDAPIFSAILSLINEKQGYSTGQGLINSTLYTLASNSSTYSSAFHDVTSGNNDCTAGSKYCGSTTTGFSAGTGYDQVTGLGSVDVNSLATAWPASTTTTAPAATTTTITASSSPNVNASDSFTVTVAATSGTPSGTVSLTVDTGTAVTETLASNGTYVYQTAFTTAGAHTVFVKYAGSSTYAASEASVTVTAVAVSSGNGTIALTSSPATLSVNQGSSANETITVTPGGGYTGTVNLTADTSDDSALQNLCYEFGNSTSTGGTVAITGTGAVTTTLTMDANASDCSSNAAIKHSGKRPLKELLGGNQRAAAGKSGRTGGDPLPSGSLPMSIAFGGLLLAGYMGKASRRLRGLAALLVLAAVGLVVSACGGGTHNTLANPPIGSYTITVTGADSATSSIASKTTFTLKIN
jgi:subtilase family serine protease